jgi:tRNA (guanine-N7-)-methyltransferase
VPKKKLIHFKENLTFPHLFQVKYNEFVSGFPLRTRWREDYFHNDRPIILELGCGKGEYTIGLAQKYPGMNYIGVDMKGARLWRGCREVKEKDLKNVAFIRTQVDHILNFFGPGEVSEIWITFPDPQLKKERKRLTAPVFLDKYRKIMGHEGIVHLKTDNKELYDYTLNIIRQQGLKVFYCTEDLYHSGYTGETLAIQTYYEKIWLEMGKSICFLEFNL